MARYNNLAVNFDSRLTVFCCAESRSPWLLQFCTIGTSEEDKALLVVNSHGARLYNVGLNSIVVELIGSLSLTANERDLVWRYLVHGHICFDFIGISAALLIRD